RARQTRVALGGCLPCAGCGYSCFLRRGETRRGALSEGSPTDPCRVLLRLPRRGHGQGEGGLRRVQVGCGVAGQTRSLVGGLEESACWPHASGKEAAPLGRRTSPTGELDQTGCFRD